MFNIVLLDDVKNHNNLLADLITTIIADKQIEGQIVLSTSNFDRVLEYAQTTKRNSIPTVYFLDIKLNEEINGIDICTYIQSITQGNFFVYVSSYMQYALDCLKSHAYDFLSKPVTYTELCSCLLSLQEEIAYHNDGMLYEIKSGTNRIYLLFSDIFYFCSVGKKIIAYTKKGQFTWRATMQDLLRGIPSDNFVRINRNYVVNTHHIHIWKSNDECVILTTGDTIQISRRMKKALNTFECSEE